jgi:hypothetical protein
MIIPPRGQRSVLCVVVVTISQYGIGLTITPAATRPAIWAISAISIAPTSSAIARNADQSRSLLYAENHAIMSFGLCSIASLRTSTISIRSVTLSSPYGTIL